MEASLYYDFLSQIFVSVLIAALAIAFWISFANSEKQYLKLIAIAAIFEALRFAPDFYVTVEFDNLVALGLSVTFQFAGTLLLLYALLVANKASKRRTRFTLGALILIFISGTLVAFTQSDYIEPSIYTYAQASGVILATAFLVWEGWKFASSVSPSRILFSLASMSLLLLRSVIPSIPFDESYLILYYMELIAFAVILMGLLLAGVENTNKRINDLLTDKAQSEEDLNFIVNNTLDVVLVSNEVGLIQSWTQKAAERFGYTAEQAVGKIHMDELFIGNEYASGAMDAAEFQAKMETIDGSEFVVDVRMQTVAHKGKIYSIYILSDTSIQSTEGIYKSLMEADQQAVNE